VAAASLEAFLCPLSPCAYSSSAWRSVRRALMAATACSCESTTCSHHTPKRPALVLCRSRYDVGRVSILSGGDAGICGERF
jgi:hypothetical protein